jgi:threonine/homoserine/homoserine lactone efflux protein
MSVLDGYLLFVGASVPLVMTSGPNLLYPVSRTLCQGRRPGILSLAGTATGFVFRILAVALGLSAVFLQSVLLGATQVAIAVVGDLIFVLAAARFARWLADRPLWTAAQRWVLSAVFAGIALRLAADERR